MPQPIVTKLRDNHLNYIITWYDRTHTQTHAHAHTCIRAFLRLTSPWSSRRSRYSLTVALVATMLLKGRGRVRR